LNSDSEVFRKQEFMRGIIAGVRFLLVRITNNGARRKLTRNRSDPAA
jgi:hypothetical protein